MDTSILTIRIPQEVKTQLDKLAEATHRSKSFLGCEAIQRYVDLEAWQVREIQQAIQQADANDFASNEEINAVVKKYAG